MADVFSAKGQEPWRGHIRKELKFVSKCPICQSRYKNEHAQVLEEQGNAHLVHIECHRCKGSMVALIIQAPGSLSSVGIVTDLTAQDVLKFKDNTAITEDDCLEIHLQLEKV